MIIGYKAIVASAAAAMLAAAAGGAQAQGYYGQEELPPPPYAYAGGYGYGGGYGGGCGSDHFTLLGARAGVTVLGVDLDASTRLRVGVDGACGGGAVFTPRPYAPAPMAYGYQGYEQTYAPPPPPQPPMSYGYPCGCQAPPRW